ncbi:MAG TPA: RHS repeat-associated core domain-containing protein [Chthoniobacterales bacterium]|nr:RHS repeat-associated core domain-containing protein [Chthoniobacterales bacterium]
MRKAYRDNRDRIKAWEKGVNPGVNPRENGRGDRYEYDDAGQLTQAAYQAENAHDTAGTAERTDAFHYDEMGNRTGANWVASRGLMSFGGRNNKLNQYGRWENNIPWPDPLHWGLDLWYDDAAPHPAAAPWLPPGNGVLMGDGWNVAGFNALNQPVQMTSFFYEGTGNWMWFGYDPLGRCVKRWVGPGDGSAPNGAIYFYYDGWNLVQEGLSANSVARTYVHGARVDEIVASAAGGGSWLYHQYDARSHCIMLTNTSGGIVEQYEYDAFGQPYIYDANSTLVARNLGSPAGNRFLFTGREWLKELRVYDYRHRMYQPEMGRFLQPDPKQFEAGDYNLYRYCHNDPINKTDPTGLVDSNQAGGDSKGNTEWEKSFNPSDRFTVVIHSDGKGFIVKGDYVSASKVADKMKEDGYTPGKTVQLISCESGREGKDSPAQKLANILANRNKVETKVIAPNNKCESGTTRGAEPTVQATGKSGQPGEFKTFTGKPPEPEKKKDK